MSDPITPLTPAQTAAAQAQAAKDGVLHNDAVAIDDFANVIILRGRNDETISSHAARADEQGKWWGKALSRFLDFFQKDHGAKAQAGDLERAQAIAQTEENSGGLNQ